MKLFVNGRFLTQRTSGVQSFARELCRELIQVADLVILVPKKATLIDNEFSENIKKIGLFKGHLWEQISLPRFLSTQPHAKLINLCNTAPLFAKDQIVTIHDLAFVKNPSWFHPLFSKIYSFLIPRIARSSNMIITVSNTIKGEIAAHCKVNGDKIVVIGNKVSSDLLDAKSIPPFDERIIPKGYFLMVGSNNPRKNFSFVEAFFANNNIDKRLVIAGGSDRSFNKKNIEHYSNSKIIHLDYINNEQLLWLYHNAIGMINPSLYEGFGIPNIEAMATSCPVICSDIPVFKEVCKDAAHYFSLNNSSTLEKCLHTISENSTLTNEKISIGKTIFAKFQKSNRAETILKHIHS